MWRRVGEIEKERPLLVPFDKGNGVSGYEIGRVSLAIDGLVAQPQIRYADAVHVFEIMMVPAQ